jgi:multiple sugar transport system substrate-binding protein
MKFKIKIHGIHSRNVSQIGGAMKKYVISLVMLLFALVLVACTPEEKDDRTVIRYAAWNLGNEEDNNIERRLIAEYMKANPDIKIELINRPVVIKEGEEVESTWLEFFQASAAVGELPDVYQVADLTTWIQNRWTEDISDLAENDEDLALVPDDVVNAARYENNVKSFLFALPQARFYYGYFIDRTVISEIEGSMPVTYGISYDNLMLAAQKNSRLGTGGTGTSIAGIDGIGDFIRWLPAQIDATLDWSTFNAQTGYHFDSEAFATAMNEVKKYHITGPANNPDTPNKNATWYVLESSNENKRIDLFGEGSPWDNGRQSIKWGASYNMRDWYAQTLNEDHARYQHDIDFIGTPSWGDNHRIPVILDFIAIGKGTKHREEAYDFARYMGYGIEGYTKRLELAEKFPSTGAVNFPPLVQDEELVDRYFALYPNMTEYRKIVEQHQDFITESLGKTVPGYWQSAYNGAYDESNNIAAILDQVRNGTLQLTAVAAQLTQKANLYWNTERQKLENYLQNLS